jgi:hypothetical protein
MSKTAKEIIGQLIYELLDDDCGINHNAKELLDQLMIEDRDMANTLHEVVGMAMENSQGRYVLHP